MLVSVLVLLVTMAALFARAVHADTRLSHLDRLPMNWDASGRATWTAPRRVALATVPALALAVFLLALAYPERGLAAPLPFVVLSVGFMVLQSVQLRRPPA
jgi:hypothetical protein